MQLLFDKLKAGDLLKLHANMLAMVIQCHSLLTVGTSCSGTDMWVAVLACTVGMLNRNLGLDVRLGHRFSCEDVDWKRELLLIKGLRDLVLV